MQNVKGQDLGQEADGLRNHSSELLEEAVALQQELNNGTDAISIVSSHLR